MDLPQNVIDTIKKGEELQKALQKEQESQNQPDAGQLPADDKATGEDNKRDTQTDTVVNNDGQPAQTQNQNNDSDGQKAQQPERQVAQKDQAVDPEVAKWRQRYLSLQGKYNAEVPVLQSRNKEMQNKIAELQNKIAESIQAQEDKKITADLDALTGYGDEFAELANTLKQMQAENKTLKQTVAQMHGEFSSGLEQQTQAAYDLYLGQVKTKLTEMGTDYETINYDPEFLAFLREKPAGSEYTKHEYLLDAEKRLDLYTTISIFNDYLQTKKGSQPAQGATVKKTALNIQPPVSNTGTDNSNMAGRDGKIWARKEIMQFYQDKRKGLYIGESGKKKAAEIEADIFAAQSQGRVMN